MIPALWTLTRPLALSVRGIPELCTVDRDLVLPAGSTIWTRDPFGRSVGFVDELGTWSIGLSRGELSDESLFEPVPFGPVPWTAEALRLGSKRVVERGLSRVPLRVMSSLGPLVATEVPARSEILGLYWEPAFSRVAIGWTDGDGFMQEGYLVLPPVGSPDVWLSAAISWPTSEATVGGAVLSPAPEPAAPKFDVEKRDRLYAELLRARSEVERIEAELNDMLEERT